MTRNSLLIHALKPRPQGTRSVWRMTLDLVGQAFGARPSSDRESGR
ncbi:MAG TPA: hypothetical protein VN018_05965 [Brevundimonas sp.]|nr:hypothetical protein [Brevundimonas sp.]